MSEYKYQIYCNPGSYQNMLDCVAEKHGCLPEDIAACWQKHRPTNGMDDASWQIWYAYFNELNAKFGKAKRYCRKCEAKARGE